MCRSPHQAMFDLTARHFTPYKMLFKQTALIHVERGACFEGSDRVDRSPAAGKVFSSEPSHS